MDLFTHLVFGALMYNLFLKDITYLYVLYAVIFSILPDLDVFITPLKRVFKTNYLEHRSGSHSYFIGLIVSGIIGGITSIINSQPFLILWLIGMIFYGLHVSLDLLTTTEIPCFYPFSKKEYCYYVEKAGSSFTLLTSWIFITSLIGFNYIFLSLTVLMLMANIYTFFTLSYYLYRIITKTWISSHLKENQKYFPGILPFNYIIFEKELIDNNIILRIEKRTHFSEPKLLFNNKTSLTSQEMDFFKEGMERCMKIYYYAKWTVLPIFLRDDGLFSIRFFFLEPMVRLKAMYIQYNFDVNTSEIIKKNRSYGHI